MLPIVALTQAADFSLGLLSGGPNLSLDDFLFHWKPLPGTTLVNQQVGSYPFANQSVAANATIQQPLNISMLAVCPVNTTGGYTGKLATMTALKIALDTHNASGGTYTIATPSYTFTNCILTNVRDVSGGESKQVQTAWQFDFVKPLITINSATQIFNSLMNKISSGLPISGQPAWSGAASTIGGNTISATGNLIPSLSGQVSASVAGITGSSVGNNTFGFTG
ncbi:hypothetical protein WM24_23870 [Burkholderia ubonensis]|nr:hypothetical protein WM24_23870 [Burkholderia ubonensis]